MKCSLNASDLSRYTASQINLFFPDKNHVDPIALAQNIGEALERLRFCFKHIEKKYYFENGETVFDHLNSDHYAMFLYLLSNTIFQKNKEEEQLAAKVFLLNKALHGLDAFYKVNLPEIFLFVHPVGTVIGNGNFKNYFVIYQNCGVGSNEQGEYPTFGEGVIMYSNSSVLGKCKVGENVVFAANSFLINSNVASDRIVAGAYPNHQIKPNEKTVIDRIFKG